MLLDPTLERVRGLDLIYERRGYLRLSAKSIGQVLQKWTTWRENM